VGLNETQDVSIWIADVELCPIWHVAQWDNKCNAGRRETLRERLCTLNADIDVDVLFAIKCNFVAWWRGRALQMNVATVAANAGVKALIHKLDSEAKAVAIERERTSDIRDSKHRRDIGEALGSFCLHRSVR
jgi:hypothetical protein